MDTSPVVIDATFIAGLIENLSEKLLAGYIFPDAAGQICAGLQKHLTEGDYADISEGEFLALALTLHMQEVNHDEHLWVRWHAEALPDDDGQLRFNPEWQEERRLEAKLDNYGLHRVERLPGNVGYLDIRYFQRPEWGGDAVAAAMSFLADVNALIIDLRQCTGGYPAMIALACSYLFGEEPVHLGSIYWRDEDRTQEYWTLPAVPGRHFGDRRPVYALISRVTFSGGEGFADILKSRQRAILIGEKTDGGAHAGASYRLHPHFEVFIPIGRSINPMTGKDWEGTGVIPDIPVPQEQALQVAHTLALKSIIESLGGAASGPSARLQQEARAALQELEAG